MVRTQIQLTDTQARQLREIAEREDVSMSEIVRRGLEAMAERHAMVSDEEKKKRALAAVGRFRGGRKLSASHDQFFGEVR